MHSSQTGSKTARQTDAQELDASLSENSNQISADVIYSLVVNKYSCNLSLREQSEKIKIYMKCFSTLNCG